MLKYEVVGGKEDSKGTIERMSNDNPISKLLNVIGIIIVVAGLI